jgi:hypothetical protein
MIEYTIIKLKDGVGIACLDAGLAYYVPLTFRNEEEALLWIAGEKRAEIERLKSTPPGSQ